MNATNFDNLSDNDLVTKTLAGDRAAFGVLVKRTERLVAQVVCKLIDDREEQRDMAQEVYLKAYSKLGTFRFQSKFSTWLAQIAYNSCFDRLRKRKVFMAELPEDVDDHPMMPGTSTPFERPVEQKDLSLILASAIEKLPPVYRTLVALFHQEELSYEEISTVAGLPIGTVKNYLFRARKMLRTKLLEKYTKEEL